jgi:proline dehydrogenase
VRGLPGGEPAAYTHARRYVAGRERTDAFAVAHELVRDGLSCSVDFFGQGVSGPAEPDQVTEAYVRLAGALDQAPPATFLSLDLTHIGIDQPDHLPHERLELAHEPHHLGAELSLSTHDPVLREALLLALPDVGVEMLLGVRPDDARAIAARNVAGPGLHSLR